MSKFGNIFKKVNGSKVLKDYARAHVLFYAMFMTLCLGFTKKSLELVRNAVQNKILNRLRKKYRKFISNFKSTYSWDENNATKTNKVWICWLQGVEDAPTVVKKCYSSLLENLKDREVILITEENYSDFVTLPSHILEKYKKGIITRTHFTDFIRLKLLTKEGGTWIDLTVLCTSSNIPKYLLDSKLFIYQLLKPGADGNPLRVSTWFMTSYNGHPILELTKQLLYEYWKKKNYMVDYFLIHHCIELSIEAYENLWNEMVPVSSAIPHLLLLRFGQEFNQNLWDDIKSITPFHKLSYKMSEEEYKKLETPNTFYNEVIINNK